MLNAPRTVAGSRIVGLGHYQPERVLTNAELATMVDTSDEWIRTRTGIVERHIARDDETVADMAAAAARAAIADAGLTPGEVELVIVASTSVMDHSPNVAGRVAAELGMTSPVIIDVNTACSGFEHGIALADASIRSAQVTRAVVIGAEKLSSITDWSDRTTCVLTADGAGAFVLEATEEPGVGPIVWGSEPTMSRAVIVEEATDNKFTQDGRMILRWAMSKAAAINHEAVRTAGLTMDDIQVFVPHQANLRIIEPLAEQLGLTDRTVVTDVQVSGNTSAASIPLGLSKWWHEGRIPANAPTLLFGFGGGFAYASQVVLTPDRRP
ncbi:beta-ketoacyl-ACP synthase 3 [Gryllotalpicola ginsengisoli]|uniref:beta-ketoacyl-ACP synthase 3 n=1 Tax=Gryllotalpicola ginsengisoli TaxID=444608 RepID=UPI00041FE194|nr:beta-ketoacyl-ACP synthase 3 [Gryllotalpicola ginsengisoli]